MIAQFETPLGEPASYYQWQQLVLSTFFPPVGLFSSPFFLCLFFQRAALVSAL